MYQALYRKYRPRRFSDVVGQDHITGILRRQVATGRTSHAYLFVGTRGTGKTTCAKILSRALNCEHPVDGDPCNNCDACRGIESGSIMDVVEIDAASNNGVDNIRAIRDEAVYSPAEVRRRVYIIDEVHMLSVSAFNALLKILEEPPEHLVFILATTELNKVPATILSRCQHFSFKRISPEDIAGRLRYVADREGFTLTDGAAALLSRLADGSMRDALSLLDQCLSGGTVDEDAVINAVGLMGDINTSKLWQLAASGDLPGTLELFERIYFGGAEPLSVLRDLLSLARDMLLVRAAPKGCTALLSGAFSPEALSQLSGGMDIPRLLAVSETLQESVDSMKDARDKRTKAELCLIKLIGRMSGAYVPPQAFDPAPQAPARQPRRQPVQSEPPVMAPKSIRYEASAQEAAPVQERQERNAAPAVRSDAPPPPWEDEAPPVSSAPPDDDAPPPFDDTDAPPEDPSFWQEPPVRNAARAPEAPSAPRAEPKAYTEPSGQDAGLGAMWAAVIGACQGSVPDGAYTYLRSSSDVVPELMGDNLVLHVKNMFVQMMVGASAVKAAVSRAASEFTGRSVNVSVSVGIPEGLTAPSLEPVKPTPKAAEKPVDKLDMLSKFDGVVKFT